MGFARAAVCNDQSTRWKIRDAAVSGGEYLALAYLVVFATVLVYVVIIAAKLVRLEREVAELAELARARRDAPEREVARVG
jgi:CcmD family protein